jgi:hypothetical protein
MFPHFLQGKKEREEFEYSVGGCVGDSMLPQTPLKMVEKKIAGFENFFFEFWVRT